ncbi:MAG: methionyl-tRNA formyltransferase [Erysipelotrichaceae bacterium]|nr:methionyl-tRNA formyltransferase [Erysipelotrichaceae bacterium]
MNKKDARLIFMGTPEISAHVFERMILDGYNFVGLISQPDKPIGRKNEIEISPTKKIALKYGIPVFQPIKIRLEFEFVRELKPDLIVTFAYGQIVPQGLLDIPTLGCINLHGSLLPKLRGASPVQFALINGDKKTGVTLMRMLKEMDAGEMYGKKEVQISDEDNATTLFNKISLVAGDLILELLPDFLKGKIKGIPQNNDEVTFASIIKPEQEKISFDLSSKSIIGWIRGLSEKPGGYFLLNGKKFKVYNAKFLDDKITGQVGEIVEADKNGLILQAKDGRISLLEIQIEGKRKMDYKTFVNGYKDLKGIILK